MSALFIISRTQSRKRYLGRALERERGKSGPLVINVFSFQNIIHVKLHYFESNLKITIKTTHLPTYPNMAFVLVGAEVPPILHFLLREDETLLEQEHLAVFGTQLGELFQRRILLSLPNCKGVL